MSLRRYILITCLLHIVTCVKVKVFMRSDSQEDSRVDEEFAKTDSWDKRHVTLLPYIRKHSRHERREKELEEKRREEKSTTEKATPLHPNAILFPLIYKQVHIQSMFMFEQTWYTWSTEKRTDGSSATIYYVCYKEPKHCDDVGWERTDTPPKCAFEIDALLPEDRACVNPYGVEPRGVAGCDGGDVMKVKDIVRSCGPRIRSLWRFVRVGPRPADAAKPADVNSLICEDEDECVVNVEYRIHHDRITFALYEPTRGQTFKSALKRDLSIDEKKPTPPTEARHRHKSLKTDDDRGKPSHFKTKYHGKTKKSEGKALLKERNDSGYSGRRVVKNKLRSRDDDSEDISEN